VHLKNNAAKRPQISCEVRLAVFDHLWCHIVYCSHESALPLHILLRLIVIYEAAAAVLLNCVICVGLLFYRLLIQFLSIAQIDLH